MTVKRRQSSQASQTEFLNELKSLCLGRVAHIEDLHAILDNLPRPPSLLIYGQSGTGKTDLLHKYFAQVDQLVNSDHLVNYAFIDMRQCITQRTFYERTLDELLQNQVELDSRKEVILSQSIIADNLDSFKLELHRALDKVSPHTILIFDHFSMSKFDNAEAIMTTIDDVFQAFDGHATAIFVTSQYADIPRWMTMPSIHFEPLASESVLSIMSADLDEVRQGIDFIDDAQWPTVWRQYLSVIYETFYDLVGHDLQMYRILARKLLPEYLKPVRKGRFAATNTTQLMKASAAAMANDLWILEEEQMMVEHSVAASASKAGREGDLSVCMRYLLLAAFLASYNPVKTDTTFFSKGQGPAKRRRMAVGKHAKAEQLPQKVLGPKGFPMERMVAIFQAIVPQAVAYDITIDQQIATLASLKLIQRTGAATADVLDDGKWVVNVSFDAMHRIAQSVKFELARYMEV